MTMRIVLFLLVIAINTCGMNEKQLKDFVESYEIVKEIFLPNDTDSFVSILHDSHGNRLIAGTMDGIGVWGCEGYKLTYFDSSSTNNKDIVYDQENDLLYYIGGDNRKVWSKDMQQGKDGKHTDLLSLDRYGCSLAYNVAQKQLSLGLFNGLTVVTPGKLESKITRPLYASASYQGEVRTLDFGNINGTEIIYLGLSNGEVQMRTDSNNFYKSKSLGNFVSLLRVDQYRNHVWVNGMKRGVITQCDMDLENAKNIQYAGALTSTQAFEHDCISNLLCIASHSDIVPVGANFNMLHIVFPQITDDFGTPIIQMNICLKSLPRAVACDYARNTFYVALLDRICVVKPKTPLLMALNTQAFFIYSHFLPQPRSVN